MIVDTVRSWLSSVGQTSVVITPLHNSTMCVMRARGLERHWTIVCVNPSADPDDVFMRALGMAISCYSRTEPPTTIGLALPDTLKFKEQLALLSRDVVLETPYLRILLVRDGEGVSDAVFDSTIEAKPPSRNHAPGSRAADLASQVQSTKHRKSTDDSEPVHPSMRSRTLPAQPLANPVATITPVQGSDYDGLELPRLGSQYNVLDRMPKRRR